MAFSRSGAPAPTMSANTTDTTTARMTAMQQRAAQSNALQAASPAKPVEITSADGQHMTVSFSDVRNFICAKATDAECKIFLETCKQYRLNPFTKEAYLIHYDNNSEETPSTIVLGKNCYLQMAERHPSYDGFEASSSLTRWLEIAKSGRVPSFTRTRIFWAAGPRSIAKTAPVPATRK